MTDELDPGLRRLFAETAEAPADEAFVQGVTTRASRERRLGWMARGLIGLAIAALLVLVVTALAPVVARGAGAVTALVTSSPVGWVVGLGLVLAGVVCVRTLAPLVGMRRP